MSATSISIPAPRAARRRPIPVAFVITAVAVVAALVLGYVGSNVWASIQQNNLTRRFERAAAGWTRLDPVARSDVTFAAGEPVARLAAPSIGLDVIVVEGATPGIMRRAPGHLAGSATPGAEGVAIVAGNRFGFGSFFMRLDRLEVGDHITTESLFGRTTYTVQESRVVPEDRLDLGTDSTLRVLVLFGSSRLIGGSDRIVVRAVAEEGA